MERQFQIWEIISDKSVICSVKRNFSVVKQKMKVKT